MATQDGTIETIEKLIETCRDGQNGYREAAEHVKDSQIRSWFSEQSLQRAQFARELEAHVQRLGKHDPDRKGSVSGTLHRKWFELKEKLSGSDESVLAEVERGEDNAKHTYEDTLRGENPPADIRPVVERQAQSIFAAHDRAKSLREQYKNAA